MAQFEHDNDGVSYESTTESRIESLSTHYQNSHDSSLDVHDSNDSDLQSKTIQLFRESSESQLRETSEMMLRNHLARLMSEAKRVQRELERRMIYAHEMNGIRLHKPQLTYEQRELLTTRRRASDEDLAREAKKRQREEKRQELVKNAMATLQAAIDSGKISKSQLRNYTAKLARKG
jgi:hypothetical protein